MIDIYGLVEQWLTQKEYWTQTAQSTLTVLPVSIDDAQTEGTVSGKLNGRAEKP